MDVEKETFQQLFILPLREWHYNFQIMNEWMMEELKGKKPKTEKIAFYHSYFVRALNASVLLQLMIETIAEEDETYLSQDFMCAFF